MLVLPLAPLLVILQTPDNQCPSIESILQYNNLGAVHILRSAEGGGRGSENFLQCTSGGVGGYRRLLRSL